MSANPRHREAKHTFSRRDFLRFTTGTLIALPTVAGGYVVPPLEALAESQGQSEEHGGDALEATTKITMVSASEVGFLVADTSDGGRTKVAGAKVTIYSRFNKRTVTGTTDDQGEVVLDIASLAERDLEDLFSKDDDLESYAFNGSITVTCKGYREFEISKLRIEGGGGVLVPVRSLSNTVPYPRKVTFDEWDVLYTKNAFGSTLRNDENHKLVVELRQLENKAATVYLKLERDKSTVLSTTGSPKNGTLEVTFKGKYLLTNHADVFPITGDEQYLNSDEALDPNDHAFYIELVQGTKHYTWPIHLMTYHLDVEEPSNLEGASMSLLNTAKNANTGLDLTWPKDLPVVGGGNIKPFAPDLAVNVNLNPWGLLQITAKTPSWGYKNDNGKDESKHGWKTWPRKTATQQFEDTLSKMESGTDKAINAYDKATSANANDKGGSLGLVHKMEPVYSISATGNFQLVALAKWDSIKRFYEGMLAGQLFISVNTAATWSFFLGPIPMLATLAFDWTTIISLCCAMYTKPDPSATASLAAADLQSWQFDYSNTGLTITLCFIPSFTFGVGLKAVASVSAKASFTLTLVFGFTINKDLAGKKHEVPHMVFGFAAQITIVLSFFLFTASFPVKNWKYRDFYDNWKGGLVPMAEDPMDALAEADLEELMDSMNIITDDMLLSTQEQDGYLVASADTEEEADGDDEAFDWESMRQPDIKAALDDGRVITYAVYQVVPDDELEGSVAAQSEHAEQSAGISEDGSALAVQAQTQDSVAVRKRSPLRRHRSENEYVRTGISALAEGDDEILMDPAVKELGRFGGIRPESDKVIATNVYGDPRVKIVDMHSRTGNTYLRATCSFRIGSIRLIDKDGNEFVRTRVMMTVIDADSSDKGLAREIIGTTQPIDFKITGIKDENDNDVSHNDLYDYSFDLAFSSAGNADTVHLVVVSGRREDGDTTTLTQVSSDLVFSYVNFHVYEAFGGRTAYVVKSIPASASMGGEPGEYHAISNVTCATNGTEESNSIVVAYLDYMAEDAEDILSIDTDSVTTRVSFALINQKTGKWQIPDRSEMDDVLTPIEKGVVHRMELSPKIGEVYTLTITTFEETYFYVVRLDEEHAVFTSIKQAAVLEDTMRLLPWTGHDCFLTTYPTEEYFQEINENGLWSKPDEWDRSKWVLQKATWGEEFGTPVLQFEPIGPEGFNVENFGVNNSGTFIFWPQTREDGDRRVYDDAGGYEEVEDGPLYQLMACRIHDGIFSDPFVAADLPHDLASIEIVASRDETAPLEVLSVQPLESEALDEEGNPIQHAVNVWYTAIPHLKCVTATGCLAPVPFVSPGGRIMFHVALRNDGNSYLGGCTVQLCVHDVVKDDDGNIVEETATRVPDAVAQLVFGKDTLVESHYNPVVDGEFQNIEHDFALAPGKQSIYKVFVSVPEDWENEKYVSFIAYKPELAAGGGLTSSADEEIVYQEFSIDPGVYKPMKGSANLKVDRNQRFMSSITVGEAVARGDGFDDAPLTYWDEAASGMPGANGSGSTGTTGTRTASPSTGDPISGAIAAGIATAGAALTAYGIRRSANENGKRG